MANEDIQGFAGLDIDKLKNVVGSVIDSGDDIGDVVAFIREHGDDIVDLVKRLPELLGSTAKALGEAGDDVGAAASFLTGGDNTDRGVKALSGVAGDALDACRDELGSAKRMLEVVGEQFEKLPIPDGGIGEKVGNAAARFDAVGDRLADVAKQLRSLGEAVDKAGEGLSRTAEKLSTGGSALKSLGD